MRRRSGVHRPGGDYGQALGRWAEIISLLTVATSLALGRVFDGNGLSLLFRVV